MVCKKTCPLGEPLFYQSFWFLCLALESLQCKKASKWKPFFDFRAHPPKVTAGIVRSKWHKNNCYFQHGCPFRCFAPCIPNMCLKCRTFCFIIAFRFTNPHSDWILNFRLIFSRLSFTETWSLVGLLSVPTFSSVFCIGNLMCRKNELFFLRFLNKFLHRYRWHFSH